MKKWMRYTLITVFTASSASAAIWPFGSNEKTEEPPAVERPQPGRPGMQRKGQQGNKRDGQKGNNEKRGGEMKAHRNELKSLAAAVQSETDPAKKEALIGQIRAKMTAGAEKMQEEYRKRLERAEQGVEKLKQRLADAEKNRDQRVEENLQRLLSGEKMERPDGKHFEGKRPDGKRPDGKRPDGKRPEGKRRSENAPRKKGLTPPAE
jgi:hypothetical protein